MSGSESGLRRGNSPAQDREWDYLKTTLMREDGWDEEYLDGLSDADKEAILDAWAEDAHTSANTTAATHDLGEGGEHGDAKGHFFPDTENGHGSPRSFAPSDEENGESSGRAVRYQESPNPHSGQALEYPPEKGSEKGNDTENPPPFFRESPSEHQKKGKKSSLKKGRFLNECSDPNFNPAFILGQGPPARNLRPRLLNQRSGTATAPVHSLDHDDQPGTSGEPEGQPGTSRRGNQNNWTCRKEVRWKT